MTYRYLLLCTMAASMLTAEERLPQPETVMVVLHAKPGSEAELAGVLARHWSAARKLNLVYATPHLTLRAAEEGKTYFVETFTWRDAAIPDSAPPPIQAIWSEMIRATEPRAGKPAIEIIPVSVVAPPAAGRTE